MPIASAAFKAWLSFAGLPAGVSELARVLSLKRTTLHQQLLSNRVKESTLISAVRTVGLDPIIELSKFSGFERVAQDAKPPTVAELLSQVSHADVLVEILVRSGATYSDALTDLRVSAPIPVAGATRAWIAAIDPGEIRRDLAAFAGIAAPNLSAQISQDRLPPLTALEASRLAGVSSSSGLVVTGLLDPAEAAWPSAARETALATLDEVSLIELARTKLTYIQRQAVKKAEDGQTSNRYWENLG